MIERNGTTKRNVGLSPKAVLILLEYIYTPLMTIPHIVITSLLESLHARGGVSSFIGFRYFLSNQSNIIVNKIIYITASLCKIYLIDSFF